jgi:NitT/TauT family transport system substrate-binding protein
MRFNGGKDIMMFFSSRSRRIVLFAVLWLGFISWMHYRLNVESGTVETLQMGYMPVLTNLAAPLLDQATITRSDIRFKAVKFASFAEMAEALRNDRIQAAFMIAPLSVVMRQQGEDVKVVYIGNRHESTLVVKKGLNITSIEGLKGRTVAVPIRFSGHNLCLMKLLEEKALQDKVRIVEMNPPDMASALAAGSLDAYFVGEPFAAQSIHGGVGDRLLNAEAVWDHFICNLMLVKSRLIKTRPDDVRKLVQGAIRAGIWASGHLEEAADIAVTYWNQPKDVVMFAVNTPPHRILFDQFTPKVEEIQQIADLMKRYGIITDNAITGMVDPSFADSVSLKGITTLDSVVPH